MGYLESWSKTLVPKKYRRRIRQRLRTLSYAGNRFVCPICGGRFRKFLPYGVKPNRKCPGCGSLGRHRLFWLYFEDRTNLFSDHLRVLHVAPEKILQEKLRAMPSLDYVSADLNRSSAMVQMDVRDIPFEDDDFDVILCSHVLEHVADDQRAMGELFRVLKPGGWAILQSPLDSGRARTFEDPHVVTPEGRERVFGHSDHVRIYGRDYKDRLEQAGFTVHIDKYARDLGADAIRKYGLKKRAEIHLCTKPKRE